MHESTSTMLTHSLSTGNCSTECSTESSATVLQQDQRDGFTSETISTYFDHQQEHGFQPNSRVHLKRLRWPRVAERKTVAVAMKPYRSVAFVWSPRRAELCGGGGCDAENPEHFVCPTASLLFCLPQFVGICATRFNKIYQDLGMTLLETVWIRCRSGCEDNRWSGRLIQTCNRSRLVYLVARIDPKSTTPMYIKLTV